MSLFEEDVADDVETGLAAPSQGHIGQRGRTHTKETQHDEDLLLKHYRGAPKAVNNIPYGPVDPKGDRGSPEGHGRLRQPARGTGEYVGSQALSPEGTFVRYDGEGRPPVTDGPFAETKDLIASWMVIDVDTYERALALSDMELRASLGGAGWAYGPVQVQAR